MKTTLAIFALAFAALVSVRAQADAAWTTKTIKGIVFVEPKSGRTDEKIDFAELERRFPVDRAALQSWKQSDLATLKQEQLDQLYARLTAGPMPNGPYRGDIVFKKGGGLEGIVSQVLPLDPLVGLKFGLLEKFAEYMWNGKRFYKDEGVLRNLMPDGPLHRVAITSIAFSLLGTIPNFNNMVQSKIDGKSYLETFPAKLFCGQSLLDARRESNVIDYAYGDSLPGYYADVDYLATRNALSVRDEIRMVRPGLYLGRAYLRQVFALVFTLSSEEAAKAGDRTESCN